ncbi:hypothetical protein [Engelhardtia mirabilis]|uniref:hypothetical protein n=1 Tax=Engelhardtia mirabilis TaxID=2528011 RepID=UPI003AF3D617
MQAESLALQGKLHEALDLLLEWATPEDFPISFLYGCALRIRLWREDEALAALESSIDALPTELRAKADELRDRARFKAASRPPWTEV